MKNEKFLPFEQYLDQDKTREFLAAVIKPADDGELFLEENTN